MVTYFGVVHSNSEMTNDTRMNKIALKWKLQLYYLLHSLALI